MSAAVPASGAASVLCWLAYHMGGAPLLLVLQAPLLPGLLQALVVKLAVADDPAMVQVSVCQL